MPVIESQDKANELKSKMAVGYVTILQNQERELVNQLNGLSSNLNALRNEIAVCQEALAFGQGTAPDAVDIPTT